MKSELASGGLELVETSDSTGERERVRMGQVHQAAPNATAVDVVADGSVERIAQEVRARLLPLCEGLHVAARAVTAIPLEASGKLRASKRDEPLDLSRAFEGA